MKHLIFGCGLVGSFLAGNLIKAGFKTYAIGRETAQEQLKYGLMLSDCDGNESLTGAPKFISEKNKRFKADVVWLTMKCHSIASAIEELRAYITSDTIIICCQNGLGSDQVIRDSLDNPIIKSLVGFNVTNPKAGQFHRATEGKLVIENSPNFDSQQLIEQLSESLLPCSISDNIEAEQWAKLQLNLANPVNALADIPVKTMLEQRDYRQIIAILMTELLTVTTAQNIELPQLTAMSAHWIPKLLKTPDFVFSVVGKKMLNIDPTAKLSMWWDLSQGRNTEIDFLNGAVVSAGKQNSIACPVNQKLVSLIHQVERGEQSIGWSGAKLKEYLLT